VVLVDKEARTPANTSEVNLDEEWEVRYWCERFDVDEGTLRTCVMEVGPRMVDIEQRLREAAKESFKNDGES
jgi:hypothetical protein